MQAEEGKENDLKNFYSSLKEEISTKVKHILSKANNILDTKSTLERCLNLQDSINSQIDKRNESMQKAINEFINEKDVIPKAINYEKKYFYTHMKELLNFNEKILNSIELSLEILNMTLNVSEWVNKKEPFYSLINTNILKIYSSSLFLNLDFNKKNLTNILNNACIPKELKKIILTLYTLKDLLIVMDNPNNLEDELDKNQKEGLLRLHGKFTDTEADINLDSFKNLQILQLEHFAGESIPYTSVPQLKTLYLRHCKNINNYEFTSLKKLVQINIVHGNLISNEFDNIISNIVKVDELRNNIESLSFAHNSLFIVDLDKHVHQTVKMKGLKRLDLHNNRIYKFIYNPEYIPNLKYINLCDNYFSSPFFNCVKKNEAIFLANNNLYLSDPKNNKEYFDRLSYQCEHFKYDWNTLSLSGMANLSLSKEMERMIIGGNNQFSIIKLDLSYCDFTTDNVINFLNNHLCLFNLKVLKLEGNHIDETIFAKICETNLCNNTLKKLKKLYISDNEINDFNFASMKRFVESFPSIQKIVITKNPFSDGYIYRNEFKGEHKENYNIMDFNDFINFLRNYNTVEQRNSLFRFDTFNKQNIILSEGKGIVMRVTEKDKKS